VGVWADGAWQWVGASGGKVDVDGIKARLAAASDGPWAVTSEPETPQDHAITSRGHVIARLDDEVEYGDALFLAAARQDVPVLCDLVERLTKERDEAIADAAHQRELRKADFAEVIFTGGKW
jgi:hypothetical protein